MAERGEQRRVQKREQKDERSIVGKDGLFKGGVVPGRRIGESSDEDGRKV